MGSLVGQQVPFFWPFPGPRILPTKQGRGPQKHLKSPACPWEVPKEEVEDEMEILRKLDHPHIVRLFEWFEKLVLFLSRVGGNVRPFENMKIGFWNISLLSIVSMFESWACGSFQWKG